MVDGGWWMVRTTTLILTIHHPPSTVHPTEKAGWGAARREGVNLVRPEGAAISSGSCGADQPQPALFDTPTPTDGLRGRRSEWTTHGRAPRPVESRGVPWARKSSATTSGSASSCAAR